MARLRVAGLMRVHAPMQARRAALACMDAFLYALEPAFVQVCPQALACAGKSLDLQKLSPVYRACEAGQPTCVGFTDLCAHLVQVEEGRAAPCADPGHVGRTGLLLALRTWTAQLQHASAEHSSARAAARWHPQARMQRRSRILHGECMQGVRHIT
eukprot:6190513-Pleurochrysis_carterae.AAC.4